MLRIIVFGIMMMVFTVAIHTAFTAVAARHLIRILRREETNRTFLRNVFVLQTAATILMAGHVVEMALWAALFMVLGTFSRFSDALYHSAVNFTTLGYGDIVMPDPWRMFGPLEAANGIMTFGITTATMFAIMTRMLVHAGSLSRHQ